MDGKSYDEIVEMIGCRKSTITYHAKKIGLSEGRKLSFDWEKIRKYYDEGYSKSECQDKFGFSNGAWGAAVKRGDINPRPKEISLDVMLVDSRPQTSRTNLKSKLIKAGILAEECAVCGLSEWLGKKLSLHLDHINGKSKDNRIENLRLLCPNCHSQTETYAGRNVKKYALIAR